MKSVMKFFLQLLMKKNYRELSIRMIKKVLGWWKIKKDDTETIHLIEEGKKIGIDEFIKYNEIKWYH